MERNPNFVRREECPVCGSRSVSTIYTQAFDEAFLTHLARKFAVPVSPKDFAGVRYEIMRCGECTLFYQAELPVGELAKHIYPGEGSEESKEKRRRTGITDYAVRAFEAEKISPLLARSPFEIRVLEFGAGWGLWSRVAAAYGYEAHAIDTNAARIAYVKSGGIAAHASLAELEPGSVDFVYTDQVFEHVEEPMETMRTLAAKIRPGGMLRIGVPDASDAPAQLERAAGAPARVLQPFQHINGFTHKALVTLCERAGLTLVPGTHIARRLLPQVHLTRGLHYVQDAAKNMWTQSHSTTLYFAKDA